MLEIQRVVHPEEIEVTCDLAREIWTEHYVKIIGKDQVEYMLAKFQSTEAISEQMNQGYEYYLLFHEGEAVGYIALVPERDKRSMFLSKIYVRKDLRGKGFGREALGHAEKLCRERDLPKLWLTVNKQNSDSIDWYQRMGFEKEESLVQEIGGGFVMDDYKFVKRF